MTEKTLQDVSVVGENLSVSLDELPGKPSDLDNEFIVVASD